MFEAFQTHGMPLFEKPTWKNTWLMSMATVFARCHQKSKNDQCRRMVVPLNAPQRLLFCNTRSYFLISEIVIKLCVFACWLLNQGMPWVWKASNMGTKYIYIYLYTHVWKQIELGGLTMNTLCHKIFDCHTLLATISVSMIFNPGFFHFGFLT